MANQPATRKDIEEIINNLHLLTRQANDRLVQIDNKLERLELKIDKFSKIEDKLDQLDDRFNKTCIDISDIKIVHDRSQHTIDKFINRLDKYEIEKEEDN